jgi:GAF domain-containing protein
VKDVVARIGERLAADRCWLYARDPERAEGIALVRWLRDPEVTDVAADIWRWTPEAHDLKERDPLFARALNGVAADRVDDIDRAPVDRALEQALGHRAFIHLNLHVDGVLWGTLQPGMTRAPRVWSDSELDLLLSLRPALAAALADLVRARGRTLSSALVIGSPRSPAS